jgi:ubiquitin carboxyl-terminal hydrolase 25/28
MVNRLLSLQVSNGDLAEAVAFLTEKNAKVPQQDEPTYYQTSQVANDRYISVGSQADTSKQRHRHHE